VKATYSTIYRMWGVVFFFCNSTHYLAVIQCINSLLAICTLTKHIKILHHLKSSFSISLLLPFQLLFCLSLQHHFWKGPIWHHSTLSYCHIGSLHYLRSGPHEFFLYSRSNNLFRNIVNQLVFITENAFHLIWLFFNELSITFSLDLLSQD